MWAQQVRSEPEILSLFGGHSRRAGTLPVPLPPTSTVLHTSTSRLAIPLVPSSVPLVATSVRRPRCLLPSAASPAVRLLLPASPPEAALATALSAPEKAGQMALPLFADLAACTALAPEQWQRMPAPCPGLGAALPAVLARGRVLRRSCSHTPGGSPLLALLQAGRAASLPACSTATTTSHSRPRACWPGCLRPPRRAWARGPGRSRAAGWAVQVVLCARPLS